MAGYASDPLNIKHARSRYALAEPFVDRLRSDVALCGHRRKPQSIYRFLKGIHAVIQPQVYLNFNPRFLERGPAGVQNQPMVNRINSIWQHIQEALARTRNTQDWLAEKVGVSNNAVTKWKKSGKISRENAVKVSLALQIPLDRLLGAETESPQKAIVAPESPEVQRLIMAFGWLTNDQQKEALADLEAKAETNKAISKQLGHRWEFKSDQHVGNHIRPAPPARVRKKAEKGDS